MGKKITHASILKVGSNDLLLESDVALRIERSQMAMKAGARKGDLVIVMTSVEKVDGDPVSYLLSERGSK